VLFATPTNCNVTTHHEAVMMSRDYIPGNTKKKYDQNLGNTSDDQIGSASFSDTEYSIIIDQL